MIKYEDQNKEIKDFIMDTNIYSIDDDDNIITDKGMVVKSIYEILREMEHYGFECSDCGRRNLPKEEENIIFIDEGNGEKTVCDSCVRKYH